MAKTKEKKTPEKVERKTREVNNLTRNIYFASGKKDKLTPKILIEGNWLTGFGFIVGKTYKLIAENGLITLKVND